MENKIENKFAANIYNEATDEYVFDVSLNIFDTEEEAEERAHELMKKVKVGRDAKPYAQVLSCQIINDFEIMYTGVVKTVPWEVN